METYLNISGIAIHRQTRDASEYNACANAAGFSAYNSAEFGGKDPGKSALWVGSRPLL